MKIGIIGYGSMGSMIAERLMVSGGCDSGELLISNRTFEKIKALEGKCRIFRSNTELADEADIAFICVRPDEICDVIDEIADTVRKEVLIVSINPNVQLETLGRHIRHKIAKAIPSITAEAGKSQTLVCYNDLITDDDRTMLKEILSCLGNVYELEEREIGMGSELVSCMPGFLGAIMDVICRSAETYTSFSKEQIVRMVSNTFDATGSLIVENGMDFDELVARVATPNGITEEGTKVIREKMPKIADEMFEVTLEKRRLIAAQAEKQ